MGRFAALACFAFLALAAPALADTDSHPDAAASPSPAPPAADVDTTPGIPPDQLPKVKLTVTPPEAAVGELVTWRLDVERRESQRVYLPSHASFGELEIHSKDAVSDSASGGRVHEALEVRLLGFSAGERAIPPQKLTVVDEQGQLGEVQIDPAVVTIKSLIANEPEPQLKEDTGPGVAVYQDDFTLLYVGSALLFALAIVGVTLLLRWLWSRRRPRPGPPPPPPRPAEDIAREKLTSLRGSNLLEQGEIKQFHILLSEALREYLGNRYGFDSLEMSTQELTAIMRGPKLPTQDYHELRQLLEDTDLVKFAKYIPPLDLSRDLLQRTGVFVERTTPRPAATRNSGSNPGGGDAA